MKKKCINGTLGAEEARVAKEQVRALLAGRDEGAAVGLTRRADGYAVRVTLRRPAEPDMLPSEVAGVPVEVRISPPAVALGG